jgi:hypothetical protein
VVFSRLLFRLVRLTTRLRPAVRGLRRGKRIHGLHEWLRQVEALKAFKASNRETTDFADDTDRFAALER